METLHLRLRAPHFYPTATRRKRFWRSANIGDIVPP